MAFVCFKCSEPVDEVDVYNVPVDSDDDGLDDDDSPLERGVKRGVDKIDGNDESVAVGAAEFGLATIGLSLLSSVGIRQRVEQFSQLVGNQIASPNYQAFINAERERVAKAPDSLILPWNDFAPVSVDPIRSIDVNAGVFGKDKAKDKSKAMAFSRFVARVLNTIQFFSHHSIFQPTVGI